MFQNILFQRIRRFSVGLSWLWNDFHGSRSVLDEKSDTLFTTEKTLQILNAEVWFDLFWIFVFIKGSSTNQGGRPLKRLKTTPTSFGMGKPSTPSSYNRSASNSPAVFRVSNSPFSRSRGSSPFNARTPNSTPALQPPIEDGLSQPQGMTLAERRSNWQNHRKKFTCFFSLILKLFNSHDCSLMNFWSRLPMIRHWNFFISLPNMAS